MPPRRVLALGLQRMPVTRQVGSVSGERYRLLELLGSGGMGRLYRALDTKLDRLVAVKLLVHQEDADARRRATLEAQAATSVRSDHVVQIFDAGRDPASGHPFLVMELLEGEDLESVLRRGAVEVSAAVDWILQGCEALAHLQLHGLVHRDIKPANLFLESRVDGSQRLKLVDFGVAKQLYPTDTRRGTTNAGQLIGSVPYLAPEQITDSRDVDGRTDVWGLGTVLYELLCGAPAFGAKEDSPVILEITRNKQPPLWMLQSNVPRTLSDVVDRCLAKARAERWPSVAELAEALGPFASVSGQALVPRIQAVCAADAPALPGRARSFTFSFSDTTVERQANLDWRGPAVPSRSAHVKALASPPNEGLDRRGLPKASEFVDAVSSTSANAPGPSRFSSSVASRARLPRLAPLAGPTTLALGLGLFAVWSTVSPNDGSATPPSLDCRQHIAYYQAANMQHDTGTERGDDWNLFTFGNVTQSHYFTRGESEISITAAGDLAGDELPRMSVWLNERRIAEFEIASEDFATYSMRHHSADGRQTIRIHFDNDAITKGEDRNLILRGLRIGQCGPGDS